MISTTEGELWSNRGNALLEAVLRSRYPGLATPEALEQLAGVLYYPGALEAAGGQVLGVCCLRFDLLFRLEKTLTMPWWQHSGKAWAPKWEQS